MELILNNPVNSLNKAYFKQSVTEAELTAFVEQVKTLLANLDDKESEEHNKNFIRDFLNKAYYEGKYAINTKMRDDLVIHHGKNTENDVAVIIETKKRGNKAEMLSAGKPNVKALHELMLYYLEERITHNKHNVKNLIATNGYEWYIFDEVWFEKNIYRITEIRDGFKNWKVSGNDTRHFYENIIAPYLKDNIAEIPCTYINLEDSFGGKKKPGIKEVKAIYKIFSPAHLLKIPFANDSNTLNKEFYYELLYILGLEERKEGSKKLISRADKTRNEGSLLENTIHRLQTTGKHKTLNNLSAFGETEEEQLFSIALELCINWLNRILFLKLLEGQLIRYHKTANDNSPVAFLNENRIKDYDELNELFFEVLAVPAAEREKSVNKKFGNIPYLNSSLFEQSDLERETFDIAGLKDRLEMPLYPGTVLKDDTKRRDGEMNTLHYLFSFLNAYDFSSDENDEQQRTGRPIINAAVLGLIFEKINGYKDGSFFTPSFITMYMCRETVRRAVIQKFNEQYGWVCEDIIEVYNELRHNKIKPAKANEVVNSLHICDPAVGSGHFLVSALNEIILIKRELEILVDANRKMLDYNFSIERDELVIMKGYDFYAYNYADAESQRVQETLFNEKKVLIENLFGVDINPKSVMICRLRLWIELLKNAYYITGGELQTLPNIDINIKCGNSLISRFAIEEDLRDVFSKQKFSHETYLLLVDTYKNAKTKEEKEELRKLISEIKEKFQATVFNRNPFVAKLSAKRGELTTLDHIDLFGKKKLTEEQVELVQRRLKKEIAELEQQLEDYKTSTIYRNAFEWRFEFPEVLDADGNFKGFDVVIGNPPYIYNRDLPTPERDFYQLKYNLADDLYHYFLLQGLSLLRENGIITLITPNTYFTLSTKEKFRQTLLGHDNLKFTYCGFVFEDAYVEAQIFSVDKREPLKSRKVVFVKDPNDYLSYQSIEEKYSLFQKNFLKRFFWPTPVNISLNAKISPSDKEVLSNFKNKLLGKRNHDELALNLYREQLKQKDITLLGLICEGEQGLVTGNNSKYVGAIVENEDQAKEKDSFFLAILNANLPDEKITLKKFHSDKLYYYELAEQLKTRLKKPTLFGKFFNYKTLLNRDIRHYNQLSETEKEKGGEDNLWIFYNRGNPEGYKWYVPYQECIWWSKKIVKELKEGTETNSRWQGSNFYNATGFGWVDYFTEKIKSFYIEEGVYSKNIVKFHSAISLRDKYIVAILNSNLITYFVKNFITATHTLQINDGRLIPIVIPTIKREGQITALVDKILAAKKNNPQADTIQWEKEIDKLVYGLYGLNEEEVKIVEGSA